MTIAEIRSLQTGDVVTWHDPDDGLCSRDYRISTIEFVGDIVYITDVDGNYIECYPEELS